VHTIRIDTSDRTTPHLGTPEDVHAGFLRPALHLGPAAVQVQPAADDATAAAWWRTVAGKCGEIAAWYDRRADREGRGA
jgi:hypothetical protein